MTYFIDAEHQSRYECFIEKAKVGDKEYSIQAVLYLLSSISNLSNEINRFFSLNEKYILTDELEKMNLSTGETIILGIAFNLYNGYNMDNLDLSPYNVLNWLEGELRRVYIEAIKIKIGI